MKGFALDERGDVVISKGEIQMIYGSDLTVQKIKSVLGTQKGEWFLNEYEGIEYNNILGKRRYASQNSAIDNQYIKEINTIENEQSELAEKLAKRLDGVS